jgi:hypothetical protein
MQLPISVARSAKITPLSVMEQMRTRRDLTVTVTHLVAGIALLALVSGLALLARRSLRPL